MRAPDSAAATVSRRPYRPLRDDPRYEEIKKIIEEFPPEKLDALKSFIQRWLRPS